MPTKRITWADATHFRAEVLDGSAAGVYDVDIESYEATPCGSHVTIGYKEHEGKRAKVRIQIGDIRGYWDHYHASPTGLRHTREGLVSSISAVLEDTAQERERVFERDLGNIPSYDSDEYRQAVATLDEFDRQHPEIIAEIKAEREEAIKRHMWD